MQSRGLALFVALVIAIGTFFGARYLAASKSESTIVSQRHTSLDLNDLPPKEKPIRADGTKTKAETPETPAIQFFPEAVRSEFDEFEVKADVELSAAEAPLSQKGSDQKAGKPNTDRLPSTLVPPEDAAPLQSAQPDRYRRHRAVIRDELPASDAEEREIWLEELKGFDLEAAREILRLRQRFTGSLSTRSRVTPQLQSQSPHADEQADSKTIVNPSLRREWQGTFHASKAVQRLVAHNLANSETYGFKRSQVLLEEEVRPAGSPLVESTTSAGVRVRGIRLDLRQGKLEETGRDFDIAIQGDGFLQVVDGERVVYTRAGTLSWDRGNLGSLVLVTSGKSRPLEPEISLPDDLRKIVIAEDGVVSVLPIGSEEVVVIGQIQLVRFPNPSALQPVGETLLEATEPAGQSDLGNPDQGGFGLIKQGYLERSNVDPAAEMASLEAFERWLDVVSEIVE